MKGTCEEKDCTVVETGTCLLHRDPSQCPHFRPENGQITVLETSAPLPSGEPEAAPTATPTRRFHSGVELGTQDAVEIMRARYAHLIGILGPTGAGKTCFLLSLYLMAASGGLRPRYLFAGSLTLQAFEDRARRLRRWEKGILPDKLADRTLLSDPRRPAFLHFALQQTGNQGRYLDMLLTDLPGEWSETLVDRAETADRFDFLHRADGIIIVTDGTRLASAESCHTELHRAKLLLRRLLDSVGIDRAIPLVLLFSKRDLLELEVPDGVQQLCDYANALGFTAEVVLASAFSTRPHEIENGSGVLDALEKIVNKASPPSSRQDTPLVLPQSRAFQRFRR